jgi:hypothetical protein
MRERKRTEGLIGPDIIVIYRDRAWVLTAKGLSPEQYKEKIKRFLALKEKYEQ